MKYSSLFVVGFLVMLSCGKTREIDSVNFIITNEGDTISQVNYHKISGYEYFTSAEKQHIFVEPHTLSKLPGEFGFGIRSKELPMTSCWLVFQEFNKTDLAAESVPQVPFLADEYKIEKKFKVDLIYNYHDSLQTPPMTYHVYAATSAENSRDTILFQETTYLVQKGHRFVALIVYSDRAEREEMRRRIDELATTVKRSYGE